MIQSCFLYHHQNANEFLNRPLFIRCRAVFAVLAIKI